VRRQPLPPRDGLGPARLRVRGGPLGEELTSRFGPEVAAKAVAGEVVDRDGAVLDPATVLPAGASVYLYRDLPDEVPMPRGRHVAQTALVRLRRQLGLPELSPAHRLDRLTAGVLVFTTHREIRGPYQTLFARGAVDKTYLARAAVDPSMSLPLTVRSRVIKRRGNIQAVEEPGEPNAETVVELISADGSYRLTPRTGRTHQLRVHMASLGVPIYGDPLYPNVVDVAADDFSTPLQLLAARVEFDDPMNGARHEFVSLRRLPAQPISAALDAGADQR
jgi:tRNA pseudouridine32 synthase/23S rRNA pseudouridine746 synthase